MTEAEGNAADLAALVGELSDVRAKGLLRLRDLDLPVLGQLAARWAGAGQDGIEPALVVRLLNAAVGRLDGERLQPAARYTFGLAADTRDLPAKDRRERAADAFGVGVDRFRKHQERLVLRETAQAVLDVCGSGAEPGTDAPAVPAQGRAPAESRSPAPVEPAPAVATGRRVVRVAFPHGTVPITVHVTAVELLSGIDVLVSSENTYFEMSKTFRSTVSGSLRRAGARKDAAGRILDDLIADQLGAWMQKFGSPGLPVAPGTVVPTSPGELSGNGVRRIYHAAVATPLVGTDGYETTPWVVAAAVRRVCALIQSERRGGDGAFRSVAFPLLGAGRGGLSPRASTEALLSGLGPALAVHPDWSVHLVTRNPRSAAIAREVLEAQGYDDPRPPARETVH